MEFLFENIGMCGSSLMTSNPKAAWQKPLLQKVELPACLCSESMSKNYTRYSEVRLASTFRLHNNH